MRILFTLVLILLSVEVFAQSTPSGATVYGPDGSITGRYTYTYSNSRTPLTVTFAYPEGTRVVVYSDFVRMTGSYNNVHPLFPEYFPLTETTLTKRDDQSPLDTVEIATEIYGTFGVTFRSRMTMVDSSRSKIQYAEYGYSPRGYVETIKERTESYLDGKLENTHAVRNDTVIVELDGDKLLSYRWPQYSQKQVYTYNTEGSLSTVQVIDMSYTEPRTIWELENIQTRKYDHLLKIGAPFIGTIHAIPHQAILSMNVKEWSDKLMGLDTAKAYIAEYDNDGRRLFSKYQGVEHHSTFLDGMLVNMVTTTRNGDTLEFIERTLINEGELLAGLMDTIIGINGYSGYRFETSKRFVFEYAPLYVEPIKTTQSTIVWHWNTSTRSLTLSSETPLRNVTLRSLAGGLVFSSEESSRNVVHYLPQLSSGAYFIQARTATDMHNLKVFLQ